jgi:hypothetical protein
LDSPKRTRLPTAFRLRRLGYERAQEGYERDRGRTAWHAADRTVGDCRSGLSERNRGDRWARCWPFRLRTDCLVCRIRARRSCWCRWWDRRSHRGPYPHGGPPNQATHHTFGLTSRPQCPPQIPSASEATAHEGKDGHLAARCCSARGAALSRGRRETTAWDEPRERRCCTYGPLLSTRKLVTSPDPGGC